MEKEKSTNQGINFREGKKVPKEQINQRKH